MVDLLMPFWERGLYRPCQRGSASIKQTLPAFVPAMSYANMGIHNGTEASEQFMDFMTGRQTAEQTATMIQNLHDYCGQDTMAMVKLLDVVQGKCYKKDTCPRNTIATTVHNDKQIINYSKYDESNSLIS